MSDSDGSPQQDDRHHRRSRSRSPVSQGYAGEASAEREERQLAEAVVPVGPPPQQPQAAPNDPEPPAQELVLAGEAAPATQDAVLAAPLPGGGPDTQGAAAAATASRAAAPGTPPAWETDSRGPRAARREPPQPWLKARRAPSTTPTPIPATPTPASPKPYPPRAAFLDGRLRPVRPPAPKRTPPGITLPQLQHQRDALRVVQEGGDGD